MPKPRSISWMFVAALAVAGGSLANAGRPLPKGVLQMEVDTVDCAGLQEYSAPVYYAKDAEVKADENGYGDMGRYRCKLNQCHDNEPKRHPETWELRGHCKR